MGSNERGEMKSLLKRCRNGEPEAWNEFHRKFGAKIMFWLSVAKPIDDGLVQRAYGRIADEMEGSRYSKSTESAIRRSVFGVAIGHLRAEDPTIGVRLGDANGLKSASASSAKGLDAAWHLLSAASRLTDDERNLLTIRYRDSLSYSEIAEQLRRDDVPSTLTRVLLRLADETQKLRLRTLSCAHEGVSSLLLPYAEGLLTGDEAEQARAHAAICPSFKNDADTIKNVSAALWVGYGTAALHPPVDSLVALAEAGGSPSADLREKVEVHSAFCAMCTEHLALLRAKVEAAAPAGTDDPMPASLMAVVCPPPGGGAPPPIAAALPEEQPARSDKKPAPDAPRKSAEQPRGLPSALIAGALVLVFGGMFAADWVRGFFSPKDDASAKKPLHTVAASGAPVIETGKPLTALPASRPSAAATQTRVVQASPHAEPSKAPAVVKPVAAKPAAPKPVAAKPAAPKPVAAKPAATAFIPTYRPAPTAPTAADHHRWRLTRAALPAPEKARLRHLEASGGKALRQVLRDRPYAVEIGVTPDLSIQNVTVTTTKQISTQQRERASRVLASTLKVDPTKVTFDTGKLPPSSAGVYVYRPQPQAPLAHETNRGGVSPRLTEPVTSVRINPPAPATHLEPAPIRPTSPRPEPPPLTPPSPPTPTPH